MAVFTSPSFVALFTCLWILVQTEDQQITVKTGDDVTLQCLDHRGGVIKLLEWKRQDLEENVFVCKHEHNNCSIPHPSFMNRVELKDPEMKDGDVSVILKNVNINDTGTYECRVRNSSTQPPPESITNITLTVTDQQITVKTGDDVTLQCLDPRGGDMELLEWKRQDLEENIFVCKHEHNNCSIPHPSFKYRVELKDPEMKDGDVSVILKNITIKDTGTYECRVRNNNTQPPPHLITTISLTVTDSGGGSGDAEDGGNKDVGNKDGGNKDVGNKDGGNKDGGNKDVGNKDGGNKVERNKAVALPMCLSVVVAVVVVVVAVGFLIYRKRKIMSEKRFNNQQLL